MDAIISYSSEDEADGTITRKIAERRTATKHRKRTNSSRSRSSSKSTKSSSKSDSGSCTTSSYSDSDHDDRNGKHVKRKLSPKQRESSQGVNRNEKHDKSAGYRASRECVRESPKMKGVTKIRNSLSKDDDDHYNRRDERKYERSYHAKDYKRENSDQRRERERERERERDRERDHEKERERDKERERERDYKRDSGNRHDNDNRRNNIYRRDGGGGNDASLRRNENRYEREYSDKRHDRRELHRDNDRDNYFQNRRDNESKSFHKDYSRERDNHNKRNGDFRRRDDYNRFDNYKRDAAGSATYKNNFEKNHDRRNENRSNGTGYRHEYQLPNSRYRYQRKRSEEKTDPSEEHAQQQPMLPKQQRQQRSSVSPGSAQKNRSQNDVARRQLCSSQSRSRSQSPAVRSAQPALDMAKKIESTNDIPARQIAPLISLSLGSETVQVKDIATATVNAVPVSIPHPTTLAPTPAIQLPSYYNPSIINPNKYAEQVQKRKLLWGSKKTEVTAAKWGHAQFSQDSDGKVASKFMRLMGIKGATAVVGTEPTDEADKTAANASKGIAPDVKSREQMFSTMEHQYEVARQVTHTMRGVGLGFSSQARPF